jgi:hypothetical protein
MGRVSLNPDLRPRRQPLELAPTRADSFPTTRLTTVLEMARNGVPQADGELRARIMLRYAKPLEIYASGSSLRQIAEPSDLVHGFFVQGLARPDFLQRYQSSGMRLRRWLMNGLLFHARGIARDSIRQRRHEGAPLESAAHIADHDQTAEDAYNRAWALALLSEACASIEGALLAEGRDRAWMVFRRHALDGASYRDLESELGLGRQQMADLVRSVTKRLRVRVLELLQHEGGDASDDLLEVIRLVTE